MSEASKLIRASVADLPRGYEDPWRQGDIEDTAVVSGRSGLVLMRPTFSGESLRPSVAHHIALLASPEVAAAVADLLDAIARVGHPKAGDRIGDPHPLRVIAEAADAVEAAITRSAS